MVEGLAKSELLRGNLLAQKNEAQIRPGMAVPITAHYRPLRPLCAHYAHYAHYGPLSIMPIKPINDDFYSISNNKWSNDHWHR